MPFATPETYLFSKLSLMCVVFFWRGNHPQTIPFEMSGKPGKRYLCFYKGRHAFQSRMEAWEVGPKGPRESEGNQSLQGVVVEPTHLENISQIGSSQVEVKIFEKKMEKKHLDTP